MNLWISLSFASLPFFLFFQSFFLPPLLLFFPLLSSLHLPFLNKFSVRTHRARDCASGWTCKHKQDGLSHLRSAHLCQDSTCRRGKDRTAWGRSCSVEKPWPLVIDQPCVISCNELKFTQLFTLSVMSVSLLGTEMKPLVQPGPWYPVIKDLLHDSVCTDYIRPGMHI